ncbi:MAG: FlgD immunoglobulin-like domain containing protein [Bacteroidota bacterium]
MRRVASSCLLLILCGLVAGLSYDASAQVVQLKVDAINPYEYPTPAPTGTFPISNGLKIVPKGMKVYFVADTAGSGADVVASYAWTITAMPTGSTAAFTNADQIKAYFTADSVGDYTVQLVAGGKTVTKTITATTYLGESVDQDCGFCHISGSRPYGKYQEWRTSRHATMFKRGISGMLEVETSYDGIARGAYSKNCVRCHTTGWDQSANNGNFGYLAHLDSAGYQAWDSTWYKDPVNIAAQGEFFIREGDTTNWHNLKTNYPQLKQMATIGCEQCHGPAYAHATGGAFSSPDRKLGIRYDSGVCDPCHTSSGKHSIGLRYAESAHAKLVEGSHTSRTSCFPCHSGKAFVKWTNNKANPGYDTTTVGGLPTESNDGNIPISCSTCHDPHTLELRTTSLDSLRNGYIPPANIGGEGKLCMNCHNARYSVKAKVTTKAPYYGFSDRFGPHYNGQADIYYGSNGYHYGDATLTGIMTHGSLTDGCVTCHMVRGMNASSPTQPSHTMHMTDSLDNPTASGLKACEPCHGTLTSYDDVKAGADYDGDGTIEGFQSELQGLLDKLKNRLPKDSAGEPVTRMSDSLLVKNQPKVVQDLWNYYLVKNDGSHGIHNPKYAVALLQKALGITFTGVKSTGGEIPTTFALNQNFPNPFNPTTNITFSVPQQTQVKVEVYDILGRLISTLVDTDLPAGNYTTTWSGKDANGAAVATGLYIYRMQAGSFSSVKKMLMVK